MTSKRKGARKDTRNKRKVVSASWEPKTKLGHLVKNGEVKNITDALKTGLPFREPEVVDTLLPELNDEVIDVNMVQRMTDSGRRVKFVITVAVGNNDGYIGLAQAKGKEVGSSIRKAIDRAKLNLIEIRRGCGSWECGCGKPHTVPFSVEGKSGSVRVTLKPAPQGVGLAVGGVAKKILTLAGVQDCWAFTRGQTRTTVNYAKAVFNALKQNVEMRVLDHEVKTVGIISGLDYSKMQPGMPESISETKHEKPDTKDEKDLKEDKGAKD